jgi:hypothetical protein
MITTPAQRPIVTERQITPDENGQRKRRSSAVSGRASLI